MDVDLDSSVEIPTVKRSVISSHIFLDILGRPMLEITDTGTLETKGSHTITGSDKLFEPEGPGTGSDKLVEPEGPGTGSDKLVEPEGPGTGSDKLVEPEGPGTGSKSGVTLLGGTPDSLPPRNGFCSLCHERERSYSSFS